jgi:predicted transposase YbfD/YdcC
MDDTASSIWRCFATLRDPRGSRREKKHRLLDIVAIALCAVVAGADDWPEVITFATQRRDWLKTFLALSHGLPSRSTFERVFAALSPAGLQSCLLRWLHGCSRHLGVDHLAIDGKAVRRSGSPSQGLGALHLVSIWATQAKLSLGQVAVDAKSNEITAIPRLLHLLDLHGALVTIDAMGCQREIARQIHEAGGDYVLTVKDNQQHLLEDIQKALTQAFDSAFAGLEHDMYETQERGHGRTEYRGYTVLHETAGLRGRDDWAGLTTIGMCYSERAAGGAKTTETRYFIGSRKANARAYGEALRGHWGIENNLHWQLDVTFREDDNRVRDRNTAQNLALLRKWALGLLKKYPGQDSIKVKRYKAALNTECLQEILDA